MINHKLWFLPDGVVEVLDWDSGRLVKFWWYEKGIGNRNVEVGRREERGGEGFKYRNS